jgi:hypothetical protein
MQFCSTSAIALHYMRLCHKGNVGYNKGINHIAILSSIANLLLLIVTNKQLRAVLALLAPKD